MVSTHIHTIEGGYIIYAVQIAYSVASTLGLWRLTYHVYLLNSYLLGLLANEGYLIISVPYNVTFDHEQVTREIYERFHACLDSILTTGLPEISAAEIADLPYYSVGHR